MTGEVVRFPKGDPAPTTAAPAETIFNAAAIEELEAVLARLRAGTTIAVGFVEVYRNGGVGTAYSNWNCYHELNSGAARLASRLASESNT